MGQQHSKPTSNEGSLLSKTISSPSTPLTPISRPTAHIGTPITPTTPTPRTFTSSVKSAYSPLAPVDHVSGFMSGPEAIKEITPPTAPREITRLSDILDPRDLVQEVTNRSSKLAQEPITPRMVHSPSGHLMEVDQFIASPNRPLAMWERQDKVRQATREGIARIEAESRTGNRSRIESRGSVRGRKKRGSHCGCWPL